MIAALECRAPQAVPIWELSFHAWDAASGRHVVLGEEFAALTMQEQDHALHTNAEIIAGVCRDFNFAAVTMPASYWYQAPNDLAYYILPGEVRYLQMKVMHDLVGDDIMLIGNSGGVLGANYDVEFCETLVHAPEKIDEMASNTLRNGLETAKKYRDAGAGAVISSSDIADNSGPFYRPHQMSRFILPYLNDWAQACKQMGLYSILHSDGQLTRYLDDIAATAVNGLQAIDPVAGMDMLEAKKIVGERLCLCGNIDCGLIISGNPAEVFAETTKLLTTCGHMNGLVLGASNAVQEEAPIINYRAMIQAWQDNHPE